MRTQKKQRVTTDSNESTQQSLLAEKTIDALREIDAKGTVPDTIKERPGEFLRDLYETWHAKGGLEGGRPRNSIRRMRQTWLVGDTTVRSLHPKLIGQVKLAKSDAHSLIELFLSRWEFVGSRRRDDAVTPDGYVPFSAQNPVKLKRILLKSLFPNDEGILLPSLAHDHDNQEEFDVTRVLQEPVYRDSNAVINISRQHTILGPNPPETIRLFWYFMNEWYETHKNDTSLDKLFVWIVDIGNRSIEEEFSLAEYYNTSFLATALRSVYFFDSMKDVSSQKYSSLVQRLTIPRDRQRQKRWEWLCNRAIVIVQNLEREEFEGVYGGGEKQLDDIRLKDIAVTAEHILPRITPQQWVKPFRSFYGGKKGDISDACLTVHVKESGWEGSKDKASMLRYMAHAEREEYPRFDSETIGDTAQTPRSIDLPSPGESYDEALKLAYLASRFRLRRSDNFELDDEAVATAYLRKHGFQILTLEEFLRIFWTIASK